MNISVVRAPEHCRDVRRRALAGLHDLAQRREPEDDRRYRHVALVDARMLAGFEIRPRTVLAH